MNDALRLKRVLLSLPELGLRRDFLAHELSAIAPEDAAAVLDGLLVQNEGADPGASEAALAIASVFLMVEHDGLISSLRVAAERGHHLSLERMLRTAPPPSVRVPPAEEAPVPDYGAGRELSLGERRSLARRPDRRSFDRLLSDPHPMVIRLLLENPKLTEDDVVRLAARRPARIDVMCEVARSPKWLSRRRVRMTMLLNPGCPPRITMPLVCLCSRNQLAEVLESADASIVLRATARELLERRPPVPDDPNREPVLQ